MLRLAEGTVGEDRRDVFWGFDVPDHRLPWQTFEDKSGRRVGGQARVPNDVSALHLLGDAGRDDEVIVGVPLQVDALGACITPPIFFSHPVASRSSGEQLQSPPMIQGPTIPDNVNAMESSRPRLHLARTPPFPILLNRYIDPM